MLTGKQAFERGETVSDAIAMILKGDVDWAALPSDTPPHVRSILRRCLQKDPQKRLPHIGVVRLELDDPPAESAASVTPAAVPTLAPPRALWKWTLPAIAGALALGAIAGVWWRYQPPPAPPVARFAIALPESVLTGAISRSFIAVSRDGTQVAFEDNNRIQLRLLSDSMARTIPGTEAGVASAGLSNPVFSPDGQSIAFASGDDRALKRIAVAGGAAITIAASSRPPLESAGMRVASCSSRRARASFRYRRMVECRRSSSR